MLNIVLIQLLMGNNLLFLSVICHCGLNLLDFGLLVKGTKKKSKCYIGF